MESGPEITPAEERVSDWWICTDHPGPTEVPTEPLLIEINVNKSNWRNFELYKNPPHRNNYLRPGVAIRDSRGKVLGTVKEINIQTFFSGSGTQHIYTVETTIESGTL